MEGSEPNLEIDPLEQTPICYVCPGDGQEISRSIHLARLAAGYEACQDCQFISETDGLPRRVVRQIERRQNTYETKSQTARWLDQTRLRGVYLNELTRPRISSIVEHLLDLIAQPSQLKEDQGLSVLVGHDWRSSSPDLVIGVVQILKRWGCDVIDVGQVNRSCFDLAMNTIPSELGIFVTGGAEGEAVNGLDIISPEAGEWLNPGPLAELVGRLDQPVSRSSRHAGSYRTASIKPHYERIVGELFSKSVSIPVAVACGEPDTLQLLGSELLKAGCEVDFHELNFSRKQFSKQVDLFRHSVRESHFELGVIIQSDGKTVQVFDERGRPVSPSVLEEQLNCQRTDIDEQIYCWPASTSPGDAIEFVARLLNYLQDIALPVSALKSLCRENIV